jgi:hypothetical protein
MDHDKCKGCGQDPYVRNNFLRECSWPECPHRHLARQWDHPPQIEYQRREPPAAKLFDDPNALED